jgi:hypothetical protein
MAVSKPLVMVSNKQQQLTIVSRIKALISWDNSSGSDSCMLNRQ